MVLKLRCAIGLALFAGLLTLLIGLVNDARSMTLLYRTLISVIIFGICGYIFGILADLYMPVILQAIQGFDEDIAVAGQNEPEVSDEAVTVASNEATEPDLNPSFTPFTPERLEIVPRAQE